MRLYRRGKVWWIAIGEHRESTKCKDREAARLYFLRRQRELADPDHEAKNQATVPDAVDAFLTGLRKGTTPKGTLNMYECKCGHLVRLLPERLADLSVDAVETYFLTREEEGAAPSTMYKEWVALSQVLQLAEKRDLFSGSIKKLKPDWLTATSVARETFLTRDECIRLLAALPPERREVVAFILATGARWSEAMRFQPEDLDRRTFAVRIRGTKTAASAKPIVVPEMYRPLLAHVRGPFAKWTNVRRDLRQAARRADLQHAEALQANASYCPVIPTVTPNDLRRTFASLLVQAGTHLDVVARLLRHTSPMMVFKVYGQHTPESLAAQANVRVLYATPQNGEENTYETRTVDRARRDSNSGEVLDFFVGRAGHDPATYGLKVPSEATSAVENRASEKKSVPDLYRAAKPKVSLTACEVCGGKLSPRAFACPHCGEPMVSA